MTTTTPGSTPLSDSAQRPAVSLLTGVVTVLVTGCVLAYLVPRHMWPHDEGQYGQGAERILAGELPHRDYHEMYSGLLSYLNAGIFWLVGHQLIALRYAMVIASLPAVWAMYDIIRRMTGRIEIAAVVTFSVFVTSVGMTHSASPTLYLSFFAILATWMLFRDVESPHVWWVFGAGICGGLAIAFKVTGLYLVAATGMAVTYRGTRDDLSTPVADISPPTRWLRTTVAAAAVVSAVLLLHRKYSLEVALCFGLPIVSVAFLLFRCGRQIDLPAMLKRYLALGLGIALPVVFFLIPWYSAGALEDLVNGLFVLPQKRLEITYYPPPPLSGMLLAFCLSLIVLGDSAWQQRSGQAGLLILLVIALSLQLLPSVQIPWEMDATDPLRWLLAGLCPLLIWRFLPASQTHPVATTQIFTIVSGASWFCMNQYPYSYATYFFYCFPLIALAAMGGASLPSDGKPATAENPERALFRIRIGALFIVVFGISCLLRFGADGVIGLGCGSLRDPQNRYELSGLIVPVFLGSEYRAMNEHLDDILEDGETILAGPDCPDAYFFTGRRNVTPVMYDFFVDEEAHERMILEAAGRDDVGAFVVHLDPGFSTGWSEELLAKLRDLSRSSREFNRFLILEKKPSAD